MAGSIFAADTGGISGGRIRGLGRLGRAEGVSTVTEQLRLMAVHAHPDDESSKGAATMARYVAAGHEVLVVTCTGGEEGSILNPAMDRPEVRADLAAVRAREAVAAIAVLGVRQHRLGFVD